MEMLQTGKDNQEQFRGDRNGRDRQKKTEEADL